MGIFSQAILLKLKLKRLRFKQAGHAPRSFKFRFPHHSDGRDVNVHMQRLILF